MSSAGNGIYTDGNGNYYLDIDEDGDIDMETIAPGYVEDEWPEEPDPAPGPDPEQDQAPEMAAMCFRMMIQATMPINRLYRTNQIICLTY